MCYIKRLKRTHKPINDNMHVFYCYYQDKGIGDDLLKLIVLNCSLFISLTYGSFELLHPRLP